MGSCRLANPPMDEEEEEEQYSGYDVPEFTQLLIKGLGRELLLRDPGMMRSGTSLYDQLTHFLENNTSTDPEYLVGQYQGYLLQLIQAQTKRLKRSLEHKQLPMLKESGVVN